MMVVVPAGELIYTAVGGFGWPSGWFWWTASRVCWRMASASVVRTAKTARARFE